MCVCVLFCVGVFLCGYVFVWVCFFVGMFFCVCMCVRVWCGCGCVCYTCNALDVVWAKVWYMCGLRNHIP